MFKPMEGVYEKKTDKGYSFTIDGKRYFLSAGEKPKLFIIDNQLLNGHIKNTVGNENMILLSGGDPRPLKSCTNCGASVDKPWFKLCRECWKNQHS